MLQAGIGFVQLGGAFGDPIFEALVQPRVLDRRSGLVGEGRQQIDIGLGEAAEDSVIVAIEHAEQLVVGDERDAQDGDSVHETGRRLQRVI